MSKCEFCGGEYKNISVHQRFCKAKKEAGEKVIPEEIKKQMEDAASLKPTQETISADMNTPTQPTTVEEGSDFVEKPLEAEVTEEQVKIVEEAMKESVVLDEKVDKTIEEDQNKVNVQSTPIFKQETSIEFNEDKDSWRIKLAQIFESIEPGSTINIKLKSHLSHEFSEQFGIYRYPSDVFVQILRDNCESWEDITNEGGGQTYICRKRK